MRTAAAALAGLAALASGCGAAGPRHDLGRTMDGIGKVKAGTISFSFLVTPRTKTARNPFGFKLAGPFAFGDKPTARIGYTQIANGHSQTAKLVFGPRGGQTEVDGKRRNLTERQLSQLRGAAASVREGASVDVGKWVKSAERCGRDCVRGTLNVAEAANTMLELSGSSRKLDDEEASRLDEASRSATYRVQYTPDHTLRDLRVHLAIGFSPGPRLQAALGRLVGATIDLRLALAHTKT